MPINVRICNFLLSAFLSVHIAQAREIITLQTNWKFARGHYENAFKPEFDDTQWNNITIPHDWAIEEPFVAGGDGNTGKLPWKGEGWYRNHLFIPEKHNDKTVYLIFDGVMAFPEVFVNGTLAGTWDYGYNSFYIDITRFVHFGEENLIAVHADTRDHESRWYPGAGIYRKVQMVVVDKVHVGIWGTYVTTPIIKPHAADIRVINTVCNSSLNDETNITVENIILSPKGIELAKKSVSISLEGSKSKEIETNITISDPQRWDIDNPVLYKVKTIVYKGNDIADIYFTTFGIRSIRFTPDNGFYLNDRRVQLKGVNLHHDQGLLGAAFFPRAMERQLEIMKAMGCNAIRTSHNMPAPELLDLCDRMGLLVFNEAFDKYDKRADITEHTDFDEFAHRNIRNFVVRDRNHPCIFIWSVGNEIHDVQRNMNNGFSKLHTMVNYVRRYDPARPVTMVCDDYQSASLRHFDYYDVHSWNYGRRYSLARQMEPNKPVIISESASTVSTRGFYELPLPVNKTDFTTSLQVSSYDLNAPEWAELADDDFMWQQEEEYVAGEFVWTGFDYLGEPTPYTNQWVKEQGLTDTAASRSSYFGIVDLCGIPKDRYYLYKSYWMPQETTVHILPHWNWQGREGENIPVFVYTNGDCAELFINGKSLGVKCKNPASENSTERFRLMWHDVVYQPGELKAVAYKEGEVIGSKSIKTADKPYRIVLTADRKSLAADGNDLCYILIEAYDKNNTPCPLAENKIHITLKGSATIAGIGNGNPQSFDSFRADSVNLFFGKAMVIIRAGDKKGSVTISASSEGLMKDEITIALN